MSINGRTPLSKPSTLFVFLKIAGVILVNALFVVLGLNFTKDIDSKILSKWETRAYKTKASTSAHKMKANGPFSIEIVRSKTGMVEGHIVAQRSFENVIAEWTLGAGVASSDPRVIQIGQMNEGDERTLTLGFDVVQGPQTLILGVVNEVDTDRFGATHIVDLKSLPVEEGTQMGIMASDSGASSDATISTKLRSPASAPYAGKKFFQ